MFYRLSMSVMSTNNNSHLTDVCPGQPGWAGTTTLRNINPIYHPQRDSWRKLTVDL